jgi:hypothetical protein
MRGLGKLLYLFELVVVGFVVGACGSDGTTARAIDGSPTIELQPSGATWSAEPVEESIDDLSNNGLGYTGEIDRYAIDVPEDGRLQVVLEWSQKSNLDLFVSADAEGLIRLAEGIESGFDPELVKVNVQAGDRIWLFVAGWEGDGASYVLRTLLLPSALPAFELNALPDASTPLARNHPIALGFTEELEPEQLFPTLVHFYGAARAARGQWCPIGRILIFLPRLPESPGDSEVLLEDVEYILQFPRASRGLRSVHGEYLDSVIGATYSFADWGDGGDESPVRMESVTPDPVGDWDGVAVELTFSTALDPETITGRFEIDGVPQATIVRLLQQYNCGEELRSRLEFRPVDPIPAGTTAELVVPGTILRLGKTDRATDGVTGPAPAAPGGGVRLTFRRR